MTLKPVRFFADEMFVRMRKWYMSRTRKRKTLLIARQLSTVLRGPNTAMISMDQFIDSEQVQEVVSLVSRMSLSEIIASGHDGVIYFRYDSEWS